MNTQQSYYFQRNGRKLLAVYFPPTKLEGAEAKEVGVLTLNAFAGEHVICRPHLTVFSRMLAERGYPCLRFDYTGYGDSEGEFAEATPQTMCEDARAAIDELAKKSGCKRFILIGIRLGASLAAMVADGRDDISELVLWEPLPDLWKYIYAELRQTVAMQTMLFKDVKMTRDQIIENLEAGQKSLVDGYDLNVIDDGFPLGKDFVAGVKAVNLLQDPPKITARTLMLHLRERPGKEPKGMRDFAAKLRENGTSCELDTVVQATMMWKHGKVYMTHSPVLYERTLAWLDGQQKSESESESEQGAS
jgi:pimeloyl-ACP methyl ester carboxylesterase